MVNKALTILFLGLLFLTVCCQENDKKQAAHLNSNQVENEKRLIDGITIDNSVFQKNDIDLKKYKYHDQFVENLKIDDLLNKKYRTEFIKFLNDKENEDDEFKATLVSQLFIIKMIQISDSNAFYILSELSKDPAVAYNGVDLHGEKLTEFFIENPLFFVQQGAKSNDTTLLNSIFIQLDEFLVKESFFEDNLGYINLKSGQLLLFPDKEKEFSESFKRRLSELSTVECIFSPSLYTEWQNKTVNFKNISPLFGEALLAKLNVQERNYFKQNIQSKLNEYIISSEKASGSSTAFINDEDGYTNLRKYNNAASEILKKIPSGESVEILSFSGDWLLVKDKDGNQGYVHKSRVITK